MIFRAGTAGCVPSRFLATFSEHPSLSLHVTFLASRKAWHAELCLPSEFCCPGCLADIVITPWTRRVPHILLHVPYPSASRALDVGCNFITPTGLSPPPVT